MKKPPFQPFLAAFPPHRPIPVDAVGLAAEVRSALGVQAPPQLVEFWGEVGCGPFGGGELYFFGQGGPADLREGLVAWNNRPFWRELFPPPKEGGPVFFAETCFGDQLGFRHAEGGRCVPVLLSVATVELFRMAEGFDRLFEEVLVERFAVTDPEHLEAARRGAGPLPEGQWYCPVVSPLFGGSASPTNFMVMSPAAFMAATVAEWKALHGLSRAEGER